MNIRTGVQNYLLNNDLSKVFTRSSYNLDWVSQNFNNSLSEKSKKKGNLSIATKKKLKFSISVLGDVSTFIIEKQGKLPIDVIIGTPSFIVHSMKYMYNEMIYSIGRDIFKVELEKYSKATKIQEKKFIDTLEGFGFGGMLAQSVFYYIKQLCIKENALDKNNEIIDGIKYLKYKKYKDSKNIAIFDAILDVTTPTYLSTIITSIRKRIMPFYEEAYVVNDYSARSTRLNNGILNDRSVSISIEVIDSVIRELKWVIEVEKHLFEKMVAIYENTANELDDRNYRKIENTLRVIHRNLCAAFEECEGAIQTLTDKRNILEQYYIS